MTRTLGVGGANTVSAQSLAYKPAYKRGFLFLKRIPASTGPTAGQGEDRDRVVLGAGGAGAGGRGGQGRALAYCGSGLDASSHSFPFN